METLFYIRSFNKIKVSIKEGCCIGSGVSVYARHLARFILWPAVIQYTYKTSIFRPGKVVLETPV
jgi:hypothetical protein